MSDGGPAAGSKAVGRLTGVAGMVIDPGSPATCRTAIAGLNDPRHIFKWARRYCCLSDAPDPLSLRRIVEASDAIELEELRRWANSANPDHRYPLALVSAILFVKRRRFVDEISTVPLKFGEMEDYFSRLICAISKKPIPNTIEQASIISYICHITIGVILQAAYVQAYEKFVRRHSAYEVGMRESVSGGEYRGLAENWLAAVGHIVVLSHVLQGQKLGLLSGHSAFLPKGPVANPYLFNLIVQSTGNQRFTSDSELFFELHSSNTLDRVAGEFLDCFEVCGMVSHRVDPDRGALVSVPDQDRLELARFLESVGGPAPRGIVTVHCREGGYKVPGRHQTRNVQVSDYLPAFQRLIDRGYTVIRLGDPTMSVLPDLPGLIDYAHSPAKSPKLDVLLAALTTFHIGSSSGMSLVPLLFGRPCLFLNWYPTTLLPWGPRTWTVLKSLVRTATGEREDDPETLYSVGKVPEAETLGELGYTVHDLTPAEIEAAVGAYADALGDAGCRWAGTAARTAPVFRMGEAGDLIRLAPRRSRSPRRA